MLCSHWRPGSIHLEDGLVDPVGKGQEDVFKMGKNGRHTGGTAVFCANTPYFENIVLFPENTIAQGY